MDGSATGVTVFPVRGLTGPDWLRRGLRVFLSVESSEPSDFHCEWAAACTCPLLFGVIMIALCAAVPNLGEEIVSSYVSSGSTGL